MNHKIEEKLIDLQEELSKKFESIRKQFEHSGNKGTNGEYLIRDFLKYYFSQQYQFGNGEVIDSEGNISGQVDIVITNKYHPCISDYNQPSLFFIEGVSCCGEVKIQLTSTELLNALDNCKKFKELTPKIDKDTICNASDAEDLLRFVEKRPYFIYCHESQLTLDTVHKKVLEYNLKNHLEVQNQIDGVFLLDRGVIINLGNGKGNLRKRDINGEFLSGLVTTSKDEDDKILLCFVRWLNCVIMQFEIQKPVLRNYIW